MTKRNILLLYMIVIPAVVCAGNEKSLSKKLKIYTQSEQSTLMQLYREAEKKDIYPDILAARINEACAKKVSFPQVFPALHKTLNNLQWIKQFSRTEHTEFNSKDINRILISMQNGLPGEDVLRIWQNAKGFLSDRNFTHLTQHISLLAKNNSSVEEQLNLLKALKNNGYDQHETVGLFKNLNRLQEHHLESAMKRTMQKIQQRESVRIIEQEIKQFRQQFKPDDRRGHADQSRDRGSDTHENHHGRKDRK